MIPYEKNDLTTYYVPVQRVITYDKAENVDHVLKPGIRQAHLETKNTAKLMCGGYMVLDFGQELCGGIDLVLHATDTPNQKMKIVFGESVMEALSTVGVKNATNDHSPREFIIPSPGRSHFEIGSTGFRFVKLEALDGMLCIANIQAKATLRDIDYLGSFESDDERLNQIWKTGAYTVHLNMQEYLWDGIKRDRLVWIGDMHPEVSTIMSVFGYNDVVEKSLDLTRDETPASEWMNHIPSYSMWWIMIHYEWYMQNGNLSYLLEQKAYMLELIRHLLRSVDETGMNHITGRIFVDWSSNSTEYAPTGVQAVLTLCLEYAAKILHIYGEHELEQKCILTANRTRRVVGAYEGNKQVAALTVLADMTEAKQVDKEILSANGCHGLSTFFGYYVLHAKANAENMIGALDVIRNYWGAMLDYGATTFWEDFDISWTENAGRIDEVVPSDKKDIHGDFGKFCYQNFRHSLCHGWASGPTAFLSKRVLGIYILEPGCKKVQIVPDLGDLQYVKGTYPTPYGILSVEHCRKNGMIFTVVDAPEEIAVVDINGRKLHKNKALVLSPQFEVTD